MIFLNGPLIREFWWLMQQKMRNWTESNQDIYPKSQSTLFQYILRFAKKISL